MIQRKADQSDAAKTAAEQATAAREPGQKDDPTPKPTEGQIILISPGQEMQFHEATKSIPMRDCDVDALVESIRKYGQFVPIVLYDRKAIAGRSRLLSSLY